MTGLIDLIGPKTHPRVYLLLLILNKWGLPILRCIFLCIFIIMAGKLLIDGMNSFDKGAATDNELALFRMFGGAFLIMFALFYLRRRRS